jgi:hypothetical protein
MTYPLEEGSAMAVVEILAGRHFCRAVRPVRISCIMTSRSMVVPQLIISRRAVVFFIVEAPEPVLAIAAFCGKKLFVGGRR